MRLINFIFALTLTLLLVNIAVAADTPVYQGGVLTIPSANTPEQVGKYQDAVFQLTDQGLWKLTSVKALGVTTSGTQAVVLPLITRVDLVKTDTFPVQVFLRVNGYLNDCLNESLGAVNQRFENNRFDIAVTSNFFVQSGPIACSGSMSVFQKTFPLPVYGLITGIYAYSVNNGINTRGESSYAFPGGTGTFELAADNKYPGDYDKYP